eukprot:jgi/Mesvir1/10103/Mv06976-RA.1
MPSFAALHGQVAAAAVPSGRLIVEYHTGGFAPSITGSSNIFGGTRTYESRWKRSASLPTPLGLRRLKRAPEVVSMSVYRYSRPQWVERAGTGVQGDDSFGREYAVVSSTSDQRIDAQRQWDVEDMSRGFEARPSRPSSSNTYPDFSNSGTPRVVYTAHVEDDDNVPRVVSESAGSRQSDASLQGRPERRSWPLWRPLNYNPDGSALESDPPASPDRRWDVGGNSSTDPLPAGREYEGDDAYEDATEEDAPQGDGGFVEEGWKAFKDAARVAFDKYILDEDDGGSSPEGKWGGAGMSADPGRYGPARAPAWEGSRDGDDVGEEAANFGNSRGETREEESYEGNDQSNGWRRLSAMAILMRVAGHIARALSGSLDWARRAAQASSDVAVDLMPGIPAGVTATIVKLAFALVALWTGRALLEVLAMVTFAGILVSLAAKLIDTMRDVADRLRDDDRGRQPYTSNSSSNNSNKSSYSSSRRGGTSRARRSSRRGRQWDQGESDDDGEEGTRARTGAGARGDDDDDFERRSHTRRARYAVEREGRAGRSVRVGGGGARQSDASSGYEGGSDHEGVQGSRRPARDAVDQGYTAGSSSQGYPSSASEGYGGAPLGADEMPDRRGGWGGEDERGWPPGEAASPAGKEGGPGLGWDDSEWWPSPSQENGTTGSASSTRTGTGPTRSASTAASGDNLRFSPPAAVGSVAGAGRGEAGMGLGSAQGGTAEKTARGSGVFEGRDKGWRMEERAVSGKGPQGPGGARAPAGSVRQGSSRGGPSEPRGARRADSQEADGKHADGSSDKGRRGGAGSPGDRNEPGRSRARKEPPPDMNGWQDWLLMK